VQLEPDPRATAIRRALWWFAVAWILWLFPLSVGWSYGPRSGGGVEVTPLHILGSLAGSAAALLMARCDLPSGLRRGWLLLGVAIMGLLIVDVVGSAVPSIAATVLFATLANVPSAYLALLDRTGAAAGRHRDDWSRRGRFVAAVAAVLVLAVAAAGTWGLELTHTSYWPDGRWVGFGGIRARVIEPAVMGPLFVVLAIVELALLVHVAVAHQRLTRWLAVRDPQPRSSADRYVPQV
jgi:hypothetical protein